MRLKYQMRGLGVGIIVTALLMGVATGKGIPLSDAEIKAKALELGMVESDSIRLTDLTNVSSALEEGGEESGAEGMDEADNEANGQGSEENGSTSDANGAGSNGSETGSNDGAVNGSETGGNDGAGSNGSETGGNGGAVNGSETDGNGGASNGSGAGISDGASESDFLSGQAASNADGIDGSDINGAERDYSDEATVTVVIEFGVTSSHVSQMLEEAGLVEDAAAFDSYLCSNGYSRNITAGTYEIVPGTSEEEIVKMITKTK